MRNSSKIILGIIFLALITASSLSLLERDSQLNVEIRTDGSSTWVESSVFMGMAPAQMESEIAQYAAQAITEPTSTLDSIKSGVRSIARKYNYEQVEVTLRSQFGEDQLPLPAVVQGDSMFPTLQDGQEIVVLKTDDYKVGDIVVATHPRFGLIVKRVGIIERDRVFLVSDNTEVEVISTPTSVITKAPLNAWVPREDVIGVVMEF